MSKRSGCYTNAKRRLWGGYDPDHDHPSEVGHGKRRLRPVHEEWTLLRAGRHEVLTQDPAAYARLWERHR